MQARAPTGVHVEQGTVMTGTVRPSAVAAWGELAIDAAANGGRLSAEASADGGQTWSAVPLNGDLSAFPTRADGADTLALRFQLHASPDGQSPLLRAAGVTYTLAPEAEAVLENEHYRIAFARKTGWLCGILNNATSTPATPPHLQQPLLGLAVREPGATEQIGIPPDEITCEGVTTRERTLTARYGALDGKVRMRLQMTADDTPLCKWRYTIENQSALEVIRLDFPLIGNAAIGDYLDDECVIPRTGGWRIKTPAADKAWETTYMGGGSMSWMDLCDAEAGLYVASLDKRLTTMEMECSPADGQQGVDLSMRAHTMVKPGETKSREYAIGVHRGDWHWAADRYREWAYSWMKHPDNPEWVRWCDGWIGASGTNRFDHMAELLKSVQPAGYEYVQYWGQMSDGIDQCCGNFYWPAPALGGAEGFRQGIADVHRLGGKVTGYMNCQTWTRDSPINEALRQTPKSELPQEALDLIHPIDWFEAWRLFPLNGEPVGYYASTLGWYIMCPASEGFREHLRFWIVDMYAKRFGADGVYLDQTGATLAKPCYRLDHGHDDIGDWGQGNVSLLRTCIEQGRQANPDFIMAIEGAGDALGQYANLHLISGLCTHPEVYHYTFPDHILISGLSNRSHLTRDQRITRAFLNGDRFDARPGNGLMKSALRLRQRIKRWLYPGRFMDTVGLDVSDDRVLARWTLCDQKGERAIVLTFDNEAQVAGATCTLVLPPGWESPRSLHVFDREGGVRAEAPTIEAERLAFAISDSTLSAALLMYETQPEHFVDVWQERPAGETGSTSLRLQAANLGPEDLELTVGIRTDAPLRLEGDRVQLNLPAGGAARSEVALAGVDELTAPGVMALNVSWPGGRTEGRAEVRPLLLNGSLDADEDGDGAPDFWEPGGTTSNFPYGLEDGIFWIEGQPQEYQYAIQHIPLQPLTEYYFAGKIKRSAPTDKISIAVVEFVGERGLRMHRLGGDASVPANEWQRFEMALTTGEEFRDAAVYLYNTHTDLKAWYDDIELRPVE
jgi:hypothetical protein